MRMTRPLHGHKSKVGEMHKRARLLPNRLSVFFTDRGTPCRALCSPHLHEYAPLGSFGQPVAAPCKQWTKVQEGEHRRCRLHCRQSPTQAVDKIVGRRLSPLPPALPSEPLSPACNPQIQDIMQLQPIWPVALNSSPSSASSTCTCREKQKVGCTSSLRMEALGASCTAA